MSIKVKNLRLSEMMTHSDFNDIMAEALNPLLLQNNNEEDILFEQLFDTFPLTRDTVKFPFFKGMVVGKITDGEEIPMITMAHGSQSITTEDYGVRAGFTHGMIRDDQYDVIRFTTIELGKAHRRTKNMVAFKALEAGAGNSYAALTSGTLALKDIRAAKKKGSLLTEVGTGILRPVYYTHLVIHPDQEDDFMPEDTTKIIPGLAFDQNTGDLKGVAGLKVIKSPWITPGVALLVKAKDKLLYCERESLAFAQNSNFANATEEVRTMESYTFAILYGDHIAKITGC